PCSMLHVPCSMFHVPFSLLSFFSYLSPHETNLHQSPSKRRATINGFLHGFRFHQQSAIFRCAQQCPGFAKPVVQARPSQPRFCRKLVRNLPKTIAEAHAVSWAQCPRGYANIRAHGWTYGGRYLPTPCHLAARHGPPLQPPPEHRPTAAKANAQNAVARTRHAHIVRAALRE
ncbi:MAG: hypothetical protein RLZZ191_929, partial [Pseudomonadota bacterium]